MRLGAGAVCGIGESDSVKRVVSGLLLDNGRPESGSEACSLRVADQQGTIRKQFRSADCDTVYKIAPKMRFIFDNHVLGKVLFPEKHKKDPEHSCLEKISAALQDARLQGFICESIGTLGAIQRDSRAEYFASRIPKSDVRTLADGNHISANITIKTDHGTASRLLRRPRRATATGSAICFLKL